MEACWCEKALWNLGGEVTGAEKEAKRSIERSGVRDVEEAVSKSKCLENVQGRSICRRTWNTEESDIWEDTIWKEEWTDREKF